MVIDQSLQAGDRGKTYSASYSTSRLDGRSTDRKARRHSCEDHRRATATTGSRKPNRDRGGVEDRGVKAAVYPGSGAVLPTRPFFASNTSTLPINGTDRSVDTPCQVRRPAISSRRLIACRSSRSFATKKLRRQRSRGQWIMSRSPAGPPIVVNDRHAFCTIGYSDLPLGGNGAAERSRPSRMIERAGTDSGMPDGPSR